MTEGKQMKENYYIYKLARQSEKTSYHHVDVIMGDGVSKNAVYYGLTQDPKMRLSKHRPLKGKDVSMIVLAEFGNAWEALEHEAHLVAEHYRAYGAPELQGMANSGHRKA
tara:strand:+ start:232 stop:561 length:330 start_codon:yes stop_codon:yes gene_type:complete